MDLSKLTKRQLIALIEARPVDSVAAEVASVAQGRTLTPDQRAKLALALNLAETLDSGSIPLASAGIAKQIAALVDSIKSEEGSAVNPLAAVLRLA